MMHILRDDDGNRYIQCECGNVSKAIKWSVGDSIVQNILQTFAKCPDCRDSKPGKEESWTPHKIRKAAAKE